VNQKPTPTTTPRSRATSNIPRKRTPKTMSVDNSEKSLPAIISESFNLKNIDIVGKIDDMRALTKELSIMARQIEQWVAVVHTVSLAFKDNSVFKDVLRAISSIGSSEYNQRSAEAPKKKEYNQQAAPQFPFPFFGGRDIDSGDREEGNYKTNKQDNPLDNINFLEIINNPAFKEIMSKLFLQQKK